MSGPAAILREIHRLRRHAHELESEIERTPRLLTGQQNRVKKQEEELREAQEKLKRLKVSNHEKEVHHKQTQELSVKHMDQMNSASSKKEYDAFKAEIAADRQRGQQLEDEILAGMLEVDERAAQLPGLEKALQQARQEYAAFEKEAKERQKNLTEQLEQSRRSIAEVETGLPEDIRTHYNRLVGARGEDALSAVQGRTCTACYTEITSQNFNDLLLGQYVVCKTCGRILYLPE